MKTSTRSVRIVEPVLYRAMETPVSDLEFLAVARRCAAQPDSVVLLSGGKMPVEGESRYSIAAWDPFLLFKSKGTRCRVLGPSGSESRRGDPLAVLDELFARFPPGFPPVIPPFSGGAIGYFAYDLKNAVERLPRTARDDLGLPDIWLMWPRRILVHDRIEKRLHYLYLTPALAGKRGPPHRMPSPDPVEAFLDRLPPVPEPGQRNNGFRVDGLRSNFSRDAYLLAVEKVRRYIGEGDIYQANLSQRFQFRLDGDPFLLWQSLFRANPAAFYAFVDAGDHQVLSTSMERFLYQRDGRIETRPIKGTARRGATPEEDEALKSALLTSRKEDAELSMIVDLLRNDLGRICLPRTIRVREHKRLESYQNVHHMVSIVTGRPRPELTPGELLRAVFPGGSVTGCPKIRAMEIIDELEPHVRHVYTGSIGYLGWHGNIDLNIAIRTGILQRGTCRFSVGGGIVHDSRPEDEYQETLDKGQTLFRLIEASMKGKP